ncbi:MAG: peptidoglycan-binding domain-containing protein [Solirubrobacteraceae bacterium]
MTKVRVERGRRVWGPRRGRLYLLAGLALLAAGLTSTVDPALASSGGAGIGGSGVTHARAPARKATVNPFAGRAMWIWVLSQSDGGNLSSIIATARRYHVNTLMIKSGDGSGMWSQFTPQLVATLHAAGLQVCAWQYVYGSHPASEAQVGATAVKDGADCLLIDAETEYEGKYVSAQTYISQLRSLIGASFPVALAGFPYVDYHPAFPYSVFLGPDGAQYNVPQMYWADIGTTVDLAYAHTFVFNRLYQRPIFPLGQVYNHPPPSQIVRFRQLSRAYGASGVSWWDWQEATFAGWRALSQPAGPPASFTADASLASVGLHAQGDLVVWAQQHLYAAGQRTTIDGAFGAQTRAAVRRFQTAQGLRPTGLIDAATWRLLLRYAPTRVRWSSGSARVASAASASGTRPVPKSASLPAVRDEIAGAGGAGGRRR